MNTQERKNSFLRNAFIFSVLVTLILPTSAQLTDTLYVHSEYQKNGNIYLSSYEVNKIITTNLKAIIVDTRPPEDFTNEHIPGAISIPIAKLDCPCFAGQLHSYNEMYTPIILCCEDSSDGTWEYDVFKRSGFNEVFILNQGFSSWKQDGLPLIHSRDTISTTFVDEQAANEEQFMDKPDTGDKEIAGRTIYINHEHGNDVWDGLSKNYQGGTHGPKKTIQAGIDIALSSDVVEVAPGVYSGAGNRDIDFHGKAITVRSENPLNPSIVAGTIIDINPGCDFTDPTNQCWQNLTGDSSKEEKIRENETKYRHRAFYFHSGETHSSKVMGFTIRNSIGLKQHIEGICDCRNYRRTIDGDSGDKDVFKQSVGGAIICQSSSPHIDHCVFTKNVVMNGGFWWDEVYNLWHCSQLGWTGQTEMAGAAIYGNSSSPLITTCKFLNHNSLLLGFNHQNVQYELSFQRSASVIHLFREDPRLYIPNPPPTLAFTEINDCVFQGNSGTAISISSMRSQGQSLPSIPNCRIISCLIDGNLRESPMRGLVWINGGYVQITNSQILNWTHNGIFVGEYCINPTKLEIRRSVIQGNMQSGIYSDIVCSNDNTGCADCDADCDYYEDGSPGSTVLTETDISGNGQYGIYSNIACHRYHLYNTTIQANGNTGIYIEAYEKSRPVITLNRCIIAGNTGGTVGGMWLKKVTAELNNTWVVGNIATNSYPGGSGGFQVESSSEIPGGYAVFLNISNSTFAGNLATQGQHGQALRCYLGEYTNIDVISTIKNSIFWNPGGNFINPVIEEIELTKDETSTGFLQTTVSYSDVREGANGVYNTNNNAVVIWGTGNIEGNPRFVDDTKRYGTWTSNSQPANPGTVYTDNEANNRFNWQPNELVKKWIRPTVGTPQNVYKITENHETTVKINENYPANTNDQYHIYDGRWTHNAYYNNETGLTTLTDANAQWKPHALRGKLIKPWVKNTRMSDPPYLPDHPHLYLIIDNTRTTITIRGKLPHAWINQWKDLLMNDPPGFQLFDYHLSEDSSCIDAGDSSFKPIPSEKDIDGDPRVMDGNHDQILQIDIGGDEFNPCSSILRGDVNGDGWIDNFDIEPFVYALTHTEAQFHTRYPNGCYWCADINCDGHVNNFDIDPFVWLLTHP